MSIIRNGSTIMTTGFHSVNLTLAEYDALPDTKLTDGVYYNIIESNEIPEDETINGNKNFTGNVKVKGNEVVTKAEIKSGSLVVNQSVGTVYTVTFSHAYSDSNYAISTTLRNSAFVSGIDIIILTKTQNGFTFSCNNSGGSLYLDWVTFPFNS